MIFDRVIPLELKKGVISGNSNIFCNQTNVKLNLTFEILVTCGVIHGVTAHQVKKLFFTKTIYPKKKIV